MEGIKYFDAYAKPIEDYSEKTQVGGFLSLVSMLLISLLSLQAYLEYITVFTSNELVIDQTRNERLSINVNITFQSIPCHLLNMDVMDVSGEQQNDLNQKLTKIRLDSAGNSIKEESKKTGLANVCGECYGARPGPSGCCNTCEEVREAYTREGWALNKIVNVKQCVEEGWADELDFDSGEGCNLVGSTTVNKVSGNFHFVPGKSYQHNQYHIHDVQAFQDRLDEFHFGHTIHRLSFGQEFEGMSTPLDGFIRDPEKLGANFFQYYIKVVPTKVVYHNGSDFLTNQYAFTQHDSRTEEKHIPGVFFNYDIAPIMVIYAQKSRTFWAFLTDVCGIVGGVYTTAALLDALFYKAERAIRQKVELGKSN